MTPTSTWPRPALIALGALLLLAALGWGWAIERAGRVGAREEALAATGARVRALEQQTGHLETTLAAERRAAGKLAAIGARLQTARAELTAAE